MITYIDIIKRTLAACERPQDQPIWYPDLYMPSYNEELYAWIHPDKYSALFLTEREMDTFNLFPASHPISSAPWIGQAFQVCLFIDQEDFLSSKSVIAGKRRRLWYNRSKDTPAVIDCYPMENRFFVRYNYSRSEIYQSMERPYAYFFCAPNDPPRPYAFVIPARILETETCHDWRDQK